MQTLTLRDLCEEARALDGMITLDLGEWTDDTEALFQELAGQLAAKGDGYGDFLADQTARAATLKTEEQRLASRRRAIEAGLDRLKRYAALALETMGRDRVEGERWTLTRQKNPPRVVLAEDVVADFLPPAFRRVIPAKVEPDLNAIKDALKLGDVLDFARLESTYTVRVR